MKYRKKPVVIDAIQLRKSNIRQVLQFMGQEIKLSSMADELRFDDYERIVEENGMDIYTLEDGKDRRAKHVASIGDWIIKGVQGEFYPCKPDIFDATYEPAE